MSNARIVSRCSFALASGPLFVGSSVATLLRVRSPLAVIRFVMAVVVDPFNRQAGWTSSHIGQKVGKAQQPPIAHGDASSSVVTPRWVAGVSATGFGCAPRGMFFGFCGSSSVSMLLGSQSGLLVQASAAPGPALRQGKPQYFAVGPTVTSAQPINLVVAIGRPTLDDPSSESLACLIYERWHSVKHNPQVGGCL